jgi:hypothetical protein
VNELGPQSRSRLWFLPGPLEQDGSFAVTSKTSSWPLTRFDFSMVNSFAVSTDTGLFLVSTHNVRIAQQMQFRRYHLADLAHLARGQCWR